MQRTDSTARVPLLGWSILHGGLLALVIVAGELVAHLEELRVVAVSGNFSRIAIGGLSWALAYWSWGALIGFLIAGFLLLMPLPRRGGALALRARIASASLLFWGVVLLREVALVRFRVTAAELPGKHLTILVALLLVVFPWWLLMRAPARWWAARMARPGSLLAASGLPLLVIAGLILLFGRPRPREHHTVVTRAAGTARRDTAARPRNLLLISLDTVRPDVIGCYGGPRARTPRLDQLASQGVRFDNAFTAMPLTRPAHVSMLTGMNPIDHQVLDNWSTGLDRPLPTLAQMLGDSGYRTAAFVSAMVLSKKWGVGRGFDLYDEGRLLPRDYLDFLRIPPRQVTFLGPTQRLLRLVGMDALLTTRPGEETVDRAIEWMDGQSDPFFCFVHLYDAHWPYEPPPAYAAPFRRPGDPPLDKLSDCPETPEYGDLWQRMYEAEVSLTDHLVGRLLDELQRLGIDQQTLVTVVSDHGESFGDYYGHDSRVYDRLMRVVWISRFPPLIPAGSVEERFVSLQDLMPTLLDWCRQEVPPTVTGRSRALGGDNQPTPGYDELFGSSAFLDSLGWKPNYLCYRTPTHNWMLDLKSDRLELEAGVGEPPAAEQRAVAEQHARTRLAQYWEALQQSANGANRVEVDQEEEQALRTLGYIQ